MALKKIEIPIKDMLSEYFQLRDRAKNIKTRMDELAKKIKQYATDHGTKDKNGSFYSQTDDFVYGNQAKKSTSLNKDRAKEFFLNKGLYTEVIDVVEVFNEEKIEKLFNDGKITVEELETLMDTKVTYAIDIKEVKKEETQEEQAEKMPEVQTSRATRGKK